MNKYFLFLFLLFVILFLQNKKLRKSIQPVTKEIKKKSYNNFKKFFKSKKIGKFSNFTEIENKNNNELNNIDCIYCMCLKERKQYMENIFKNLNFNVVFLDSILPEDLDVELYDEWWNPRLLHLPFFTKLSNRTKLPVALSFLFCLMDAKNKKYNNIMIFEDDINLEKSKNDLNKITNEFIKSELDILYIGNCWTDIKQNFNLDKYEYITELPNKRVLCKHAMVLKSNTFDIILKNILPLKSSSDIILTEIYKKYNLKIGIPKETTVTQDRGVFKSSQGHKDHKKRPLSNVYYKLEKFLNVVENFI